LITIRGPTVFSPQSCFISWQGCWAIKSGGCFRPAFFHSDMHSPYLLQLLFLHLYTGIYTGHPYITCTLPYSCHPFLSFLNLPVKYAGTATSANSRTRYIYVIS